MTPARAWWLHPAWSVLMTVIPVTTIALWLPAEDYRTYWRTYRFVDWSVLLLSLTALAGYLAGVGSALQIAPRELPVDRAGEGEMLARLLESYRPQLQFWCSLTLALTLTGYVLWFGAAWFRGLTWDELAAVITRRENAIYALKDFYFRTIPGITTLTQFGVAYMTLASLLALGGAWRQMRWGIGAVLGLGFLRAYIISERLAIIELVLPPLVLLCHRRAAAWMAQSRLRRAALQTAPLLGAAALIAFFASAEFFRSWIALAVSTDQTLLGFSALRLTGYYVTALNNSMYVLGVCESARLFPGLTLDWLYRFPLLSQILPFESELRALERDGNFSILQNGANPEFTNTGGLLAPIIDYGMAGGFIFWLGAGFVIGRAWSSLQRTQLTGLLLYPMMFIGLLEVVRIPYLFLGRSAPSLALLTLVALLHATSWSQRTQRLRHLLLRP